MTSPQRSGRVMSPHEREVIAARLRLYYGRVWDRMDGAEQDVEIAREVNRLGLDVTVPPSPNGPILGPTIPKVGSNIFMNAERGGDMPPSRNIFLTPGMAAVEAHLPEPVRQAIRTEFSHENRDPKDEYVPWNGYGQPKTKDQGTQRVTSDSQATHLATQRDTAQPWLTPRTETEKKQMREEYDKKVKDYEDKRSKWDTKLAKARKDGKEDKFTEPKPPPPQAGYDTFWDERNMWRDRKAEAEKNKQPFGEPEPTAPEVVDSRHVPSGTPDDPFTPSETIRSADAVRRDLKNMTKDQLKDLSKKMVDAGLLDEVFSFGEMEKVWGDLVGAAVEWHRTRPGDMYDPVDMIEKYYGAEGTTDIGSKGGAKALRVTDVTTKTATISTNDQARGMLRAMMARELGRRPTAAEIDDFQSSLNEAQRKNPDVETRHTKTNVRGDTKGVTVDHTPGLDEENFTEEAVVNTDPDSEYGKYQQATSYYNAFLGAIQGPAQQVR